MKYAVTSESGMHIGLWNSRELALKVCSEYPDASIEELYTAKDYETLRAQVLEEVREAALMPRFSGRGLYELLEYLKEKK